jgi:hypothetical protein
MVECGRAGQFALDLQLRGYAQKTGHWATLYVGLTKVIDLHYRAKQGFSSRRSCRLPGTNEIEHGWPTSEARL